MELNPNFIQHLDVESLLTLFVENVFSGMKGGNTNTPMPGGGGADSAYKSGGDARRLA